MKLLDENDSLIILIDIQEKLVASLEKDTIVSKAAKLVNAAKALNIPILVSEQYPKGLGETMPLIKSNLPNNTDIVEKTSFSLLRENGIKEKIKSYGKKQIVLCGIEAHICVHQTAAELIDEGYDVFIAKDICASRNKYEFLQGIERMQSNGAKITCLEIILFEWLKSAKHPKFKDVQTLIK